MAGMFSFLKPSKEPPFQVQAIGKGAFGPKAQSLLDDRKRAIKSGIGFPKLVPITSEIFQGVAYESGASKAKNELEAFKYLYRYVLPPELLLQISEAALSFEKHNNGGRAAMVRADDYPAGLGLTYSGPAATTYEQDDALFVSRTVQQLKRAWASCLSENFQIFAQMKGLKDIGAAMLMPVYGTPLMNRHDWSDNLIYTPISINFLGFTDGIPMEQAAVFSVGAGIGGANNPYVSIRHREKAVKDSSIVYALSYSTFAFKRIDDSSPLALDMARSEMVPSLLNLEVNSVTRNVESFLKNLERNTAEINRQISDFTSGRQRYSEFLMPSFHSPQLVITQTCQVKLEPAKKPKISGKSVILESEAAVGSSSVSTKKVRFAGSEPTTEDVRFNKENEKYLLVIDVDYDELRRVKWELKHLHNAGAVVICVNGAEVCNYDFSTHLSGYFRELGILVLGANASSAVEFRKKLRADSECLVFADEFSSGGKSSGFVALI